MFKTNFMPFSKPKCPSHISRVETRHRGPARSMLGLSEPHPPSLPPLPKKIVGLARSALGSINHYFSISTCFKCLTQNHE